MKSELIVPTFNNPTSLDLCLTSVLQQAVQPDSICIADDGSGDETKAIVTKYQGIWPELRHVWHSDRGFQKSEILNRAISTSVAEYLIFIDGDVMIHPCFIARHLELARPGRFSTGSVVRLDAQATKSVTVDMVKRGVVFDISWLRKNRAIDRVRTWLKLMPLPKKALNLLEITTPVRRSFSGGNSSAFRQDLMAVNGYDESIKYGGQDKELGARLENSGIRGRHLRYSAPLIHLDHPRGYADPEKIRLHKAHIKNVRDNKITWAVDGITKVEA